MGDPQSHSPKKCRFELQNSPKHAVRAQIRQEKHPQTAISRASRGGDTETAAADARPLRQNRLGQTRGFLSRLVSLQCYHSRMRLPITLLLSCCLLYGADNSSAPVKFQTHVIEAKIPGGYAVLATDLNKDGRPDVIGMTSRIKELAWYENPSWERHVMIQDMTGLVNMAAHDIDGDGIPGTFH